MSETNGAKRIYCIKPGGSGLLDDLLDDPKPRLIRATNKNQAMAFALKDVYECEVASSDELVDLCSAGTKVEEAK